MKQRPSAKSVLGFTLIELMIVVAVVAILASIAIPAYNDSIRKARRGQGKADLVELATIMDRHYTVHGRYDANRDGSAFPLAFSRSPKAGTQYYALADTVRTATTYTLTATPQGAQASDTCGTMSITQSGTKTPSTAGCW